MDTIKSHIEEYLSSDRDIRARKAVNQVKEIADGALPEDWMPNFVREFFVTQKYFSDFIGVGESTVAGWMKSGSFPEYAKRAALAVYLADKQQNALKAVMRGAKMPAVIQDGSNYMIVKFKTDEVGISIGNVLARDIPTERAALAFAGSLRAWGLLSEAESVIDEEIENRGDEMNDWLIELKERIVDERLRTFNHEGELKLKKNKAAKMEKEEKRFAALSPEEQNAEISGLFSVSEDCVPNSNKEGE